MAFWGAPVATPDHAHLAVSAALEMAQAVEQLNIDHRARGLPEIGVGIGLNTGIMCVGDMGSDIRRSYTVIGDAVNLGSRLEGLSKHYGSSIVVSESTQSRAPQFAWQQMDLVRVKGKAQSVAIYQPLSTQSELTPQVSDQLATWAQFLTSYRQQQWAQCDQSLTQLTKSQPPSALYELYAARVAQRRLQPMDPDWDGATHFETK